MTASGHFETKSDACHCASIGLILLQELTFWRSASKEARAPVRRRARHHLERVADLQAARRGRRTTAGEAQQPCRQAPLKFTRYSLLGQRRQNVSAISMSITPSPSQSRCRSRGGMPGAR